MNLKLIELLVATGCCWHLSYFQSLQSDPELPDFAVKAHWQVNIVIDYETEVEGWGNSPDLARTAALAEYRVATQQQAEQP